MSKKIDISQVFERLLLKPEWFLGVPSIVRLSMYIQGYTAALHETGQEYDNTTFEAFCQWVPKKLHQGVSLSWASIVFFMSAHDETRSIELTKELWIEFQREQEFGPPPEPELILSKDRA